MWPNPQETADLVTFTEDVFREKFLFLCSVYNLKKREKHPWRSNTYIIKSQAETCNFSKSNTPRWVFFAFFFNCTNATKSRKASHNVIEQLLFIFALVD